MKNFTLGLNIVLAFAVAVLFYLHFSSKKSVAATNPTSNNGVPAGASSSFKIAYFDLDTLEHNYEGMKEFIKQTKQENEKLQKDLMPFQEEYTKALKEYREKLKTYTDEQRYQKEQEILGLEKRFQAEQQSRSDELRLNNNQKLIELKKKVTDFIADYNADKKYAFVFSVSPDNNIFYYKDSVYNITNDVVKGLNEQHKKKN
jgi:outer membrane protein